MTAIRQLEPWEQNALRMHDAGNHDPQSVGAEVGRKVKTVRRLWADDAAWETWAIMRRLNGEPEPAWRAQGEAPAQEAAGCPTTNAPVHSHRDPTLQEISGEADQNRNMGGVQTQAG